MTMMQLAKSMLEQAGVRLSVLPVFLEKRAWNIVIREAQEAFDFAEFAVKQARGVVETAGGTPSA
jgi:hypothetical protein